MFLVLDANIFFSMLISKGRAFKLLKLNHALKLSQLVVPDFFFEELKEHKSEILAKSKLSEEELEEVISLFKSELKVIPRKVFKEFEAKAKSISPPDDFPYVALALKIQSLGLDTTIWSEDKGLKKALKGKVSVLSTDELWKLFFK